MTTVHATCFVDCPFSAVVEFAEEVLRQHPEVTLSPAPGVAHHAQLTVQLTEDVTDIARKHDALLLGWQPAIVRLFPEFHGALTVRPQGRGAWMRIQGSYEPPLGKAGRIFDALAGRFIARFTLARLLCDVGAYAERRWRAFRKEITA